ncbi:MAG: hypothetical protein NVSMB52_15940 [Chloroflexota bacterium]
MVPPFLAVATAPLLPAQVFQTRHQRLEFCRDDAPHDVEVDVEIGMNDPIAEANDLAPRHFWMPFAELVRYATCRLANNLKQSDECKSKYIIRIEILSGAFGNELVRSPCGVEHVT